MTDKEMTLDKALYYLYQCSHDFQVWTIPYPDHYDEHDKEWFDAQKAQRYDAMVQAAKMVSQQMLNTHAAHVDSYKKIAWSLES